MTLTLGTKIKTTVPVRIYDYAPEDDFRLGHAGGHCESYSHEEEDVPATCWASFGEGKNGDPALYVDLCAECAEKLARKAVVL